MKFWPVLTVLLILVAATALAQARDSIPPFKAVADGLEYRQVILQRPRPLTILQLRCDPERVRFNLLLASDLKGKQEVSTARAVAEALGQTAVVNSSYFGHQNEILGYTERLGHVLNPKVATGGVFSAFFYWDEGRAGFKRRGEALPKTAPVLFQAGPRLVWDGVAVEGLDATAPANRTVLSQDAEGRITIVAIGGLSVTTLAELPRLLLRLVDRGGVASVRALNLDGGSSTQFYLGAGETEAHLPGFASVPVFLGVEPRSLSE